MFRNDVLLSKSSTTIRLKGNKFRITHMMTASVPDADHRLSFCARGRAVRVESLRNKISNLQRGLSVDGNGKPAFYSGLVYGELLDECVNAERTKFDLFDEIDLDMPDELTWTEILEASLGSVRKQLSSYLEPIQREKEDRIRDYVQSSAPQYRPLLRHRTKDLGISPK